MCLTMRGTVSPADDERLTPEQFLMSALYAHSCFTERSHPCFIHISVTKQDAREEGYKNESANNDEYDYPAHDDRML